MAQSCLIEKASDSLGDALRNVESVIVLDEDIASRAGLIEASLNAGENVFADKTLADKPETAERLLALAEAKGLFVAACSQMYHAQELNCIRDMAAGSVGIASFRIVSSLKTCRSMRFIPFA